MDNFQIFSPTVDQNWEMDNNQIFGPTVGNYCEFGIFHFGPTVDKNREMVIFYIFGDTVFISWCTYFTFGVLQVLIWNHHDGAIK